MIDFYKLPFVSYWVEVTTEGALFNCFSFMVKSKDLSPVGLTPTVIFAFRNKFFNI